MQRYYDILDVNVNTTQDEVKLKFRKLSLQHHPDRGGDPKTFNEIIEAYRFVSNINKNIHTLSTLKVHTYMLYVMYLRYNKKIYIYIYYY